MKGQHAERRYWLSPSVWVNCSFKCLSCPVTCVLYDIYTGTCMDCILLFFWFSFSPPLSSVSHVSFGGPPTQLRPLSLRPVSVSLHQSAFTVTVNIYVQVWPLFRPGSVCWRRSTGTSGECESDWCDWNVCFWFGMKMKWVWKQNVFVTDI